VSAALHIEVLGCHGGEMAGFLAPSLLINGQILIDAGSFSSVLSFDRQLRIDHVVVSHAHCDHVKDLAGFADLIIGHRQEPVTVHASPEAMKVIRGDLFNNRLWPDFFSLPSREQPVLREAVFTPGRTFRVGNLRIKPIPVSHPVESMGFIVQGPKGSFVYTGDTGPTQHLWSEVNRRKDIRLLFVETKFPNDLQLVANAAGHLTPLTLALELRKLHHRAAPVYLYHLKPERFDEITAQVRALGEPRLRIMKIGDRFRI
jgi:ribonuclease BN (tRNA processing enzyme)